MAKQALYSPEGIYHIYNHANGKENIFEVNENYHYFLKKYAEKLNMVVETLAYCLMPNHFHLLIRVKQEDVLKEFIEKKKKKQINLYLPEGLNHDEFNHFVVHRQFHNFLGGYSKAFNKFHSRSGNLLRQNTRRKLVVQPKFLINVIQYIHLNPVYHMFTKLPEEWPHNSYNAFLSNQETRIPRQEILNWFGGKEEFVKIHLEALDKGLDDDLEM